jgi:hypothetical protein
MIIETSIGRRLPGDSLADVLWRGLLSTWAIILFTEEEPRKRRQLFEKRAVGWCQKPRGLSQTDNMPKRLCFSASGWLTAKTKHPDR